MISKRFKGINRREFYKRIFEILNYTQADKETRLNKAEIQVLTEFMLIPKELTGVSYRFSTLNKKKTLRKYNEIYGTKMDDINLNSVISNLRKKGLITKDEDGVNYLSPYIENKILNKNTFEINIGFEDIKDGE
jgi:hypothetical protein